MKVLRSLLPLFFVLVLAGKSTAQTVAPALETLLNHTLDSMKTVLGVKSLGAALQLPNNAVWAGAKGISSVDPLDSVQSNYAYAIGSVTKTITSACILQLVDEGVLSLDDSLHKWIDTIPFINPNITIRQLLRHQSGLYDVITDAAYNDASVGNQDSVWILQDVVASFIHAPLFQPGASWSYSNTNYLLLGMIIEAATGHPFYQEYEQRFFTPLGLSSFAIPPYDSLTNPLAHLWLDLTGDNVGDDANDFFANWTSFRTTAGPAGGFYATPADVSRWIRAFMSGNLHTAASMTQVKTTINAPLPGSSKYGLGIMERKYLGLKSYGHGGDIGYSATAVYFPDKDLSIAVLNNDYKKNSWALASVVTALLKTYLDYSAVTGTFNSLENKSLQIAVTPNPFTDNLTISVHSPVSIAEVQLVLTNVLGEKVTLAEARNLLDCDQNICLNELESLPHGIYFLTVILDGALAKTVKICK